MAVGTIRFNVFKLVCRYSNTEIRDLYGLGMPILEAMDKIISDGEEVVDMNPEENGRLLGHKIKVYLDPGQFPPIIDVIVDGKLVGAYTYRDSEFVKRSEFLADRSVI